MINSDEFVGNASFGVWSEAWVVQAEAVIASLGLSLADLEREQGGLLRIMIDSPQGVGIEDCERVSHQLTHLFVVENVVYERLEVSSPGVDRALRRLVDFERFVGQEVFLKFKKALNNQKQFKGILEKKGDGQFALLWKADGKTGEPELLDFKLSDLAGAKLVPHLKF